jgi:hypothetical protein
VSRRDVRQSRHVRSELTPVPYEVGFSCPLTLPMTFYDVKLLQTSPICYIVVRTN